MSKYQDRYRVESARRPGWDYRWPGMYFITIVTAARTPWFGSVRDGVVELSAQGTIVAECWAAIPSLRANVTIDAWVVMPDHFHGIVIIHDDPMRHPEFKVREG